MANYHPLIAKAVAGLESNTREGRRLLYERARAALVQQLRKMDDPPLTEVEITRERLALEEAIRKVEMEAARSGRDAAFVPAAAEWAASVAEDVPEILASSAFAESQKLEKRRQVLFRLADVASPQPSLTPEGL